MAAERKQKRPSNFTSSCKVGRMSNFNVLKSGMVRTLAYTDNGMRLVGPAVRIILAMNFNLVNGQVTFMQMTLIGEYC